MGRNLGRNGRNLATRMKFLFLTPRLHNNYYEFIKTLLAHDERVQVGVLYALSTERYELVQPVILGYSRLFHWIKRCFQTPNASLLKARFELRYGFPPLIALWKLLRTSQADVVVIKNIDSAFSLFALCFSRLLGKKIIVDLQIDKYRPQRKSGSVAMVKALFGAKVVTPLLGDPSYPNDNDNLYYIPFTHEPDAQPVKRDGREGTIRILCVAKFQKRKNQLLLLRALQNLAPDIEYELHLVGQQGDPTYLDEVKRFIHENKLEKYVSCLLDLPWEAMREEYHWADLYILPSANEPAAVSILEAMSFGLPVICSDQNGTKCYVEEGKNGSVFRSGDLQSLSTILNVLLHDRNQLRVMGERSAELVKERHSPEKAYQAFLKLVS